MVQTQKTETKKDYEKEEHIRKVEIAPKVVQLEFLDKYEKRLRSAPKKTPSIERALDLISLLKAKVKKAKEGLKNGTSNVLGQVRPSGTIEEVLNYGEEPLYTRGPTLIYKDKTSIKWKNKLAFRELNPAEELFIARSTYTIKDVLGKDHPVSKAMDEYRCVKGIYNIGIINGEKADPNNCFFSTGCVVNARFCADKKPVVLITEYALNGYGDNSLEMAILTTSILLVEEYYHISDRENCPNIHEKE